MYLVSVWYQLMNRNSLISTVLSRQHFMADYNLPRHAKQDMESSAHDAVHINAWRQSFKRVSFGSTLLLHFPTHSQLSYDEYTNCRL